MSGPTKRDGEQAALPLAGVEPPRSKRAADALAAMERALADRTRLVCELAVPAPLAGALTYAVPASLEASLAPGMRVVCELGARRLLGVVLAVRPREVADDARRLKPVVRLVEREPVLPPELLAFLRELSGYYLAPIGEVLRLALPAVLRGELAAGDSAGEVRAEAPRPETQPEAPLAGPRRVEAKRVGRVVQVAHATERRDEPGMLRGQAAAILALLRASGDATLASLGERYGGARAAVKKLVDLGLASVEHETRTPDPYFDEPAPRDEPPELTPDQAKAVEALRGAIPTPLCEGGDGVPSAAVGRAFLLFGVTGSGKTEVYLRAIADTLSKGGGALVLVPEIALTPQLVARFRARFGDALAVLHSGLRETERHAMWSRLRRGEVRVAIGARSALFAPVPRLSLLVVDEEHDGSFKQEDGVRYHARDMALLRAHRAGAAVVLGSATPSLEAVELVRRGKLTELALETRAHAGAVLPELEVVDLRRYKAGPTGHSLVSLPLYRALERTLAEGGQAILFLNRRGFAPTVVCDDCGHTLTCPACAVSLTHHRTRGGGADLRCHYCDYSDALPSACPSCSGGPLSLEGLGTERLEDAIAGAFPSARVARLDRDVASGASAEAILARMRQKEVDVLVGTQMVTKGHDLPDVTLVGVVNADAALGQPDFRAAERGFQLLVQVAGRAGRHQRPGRVLVQTRNPEHPAIVFAKRHDVRGFQARELRDRAELLYPPFSRLVLLRIDCLDEPSCLEAARALAAAARASRPGLDGTVIVRGPAPAPIARLRGRFRYRVLLRSADRAALREAVRATQAVPLDRRVRLAIDIDPVGMG